MDIWEPLKQLYLNAYHPTQASAYRAQRKEEERLYQRGCFRAIHARQIRGKTPTFGDKPDAQRAPPLAAGANVVAGHRARSRDEP